RNPLNSIKYPRIIIEAKLLPYLETLQCHRIERTMKPIGNAMDQGLHLHPEGLREMPTFMSDDPANGSDR
ncbi:hypothetical protein JI666_21515, partial [Bacillus sp. NTK071]|uniref:hypothetical protein n=1 Tax=Bacillus sp. NTK071 TaxID=2802175 RepID=UPI001A8EE770